MARQLTLEIAVEKTRAQQELRELEQGLKNLEGAALKTGSATDKQTAAYDNLSKRAADAKTKIKSLGDETKSTTVEQDKATKATGMMSSAILKYVSAGAIIAAVKWTADWADRLEELSKQTGLSITMVQKLDQITKQNGATIETLSRAFGTLQDRLAGGDKSAVRAFDKLGLSVDTFLRMRPDDQIENFAIAVAKIEDPMQRANVVTDALGKGGIALIPTLLEIAKGMDGISVAAEANVKAVGKLSDWWETLKGTGARLIVDALGPMVTAWEKLTLGTEGFLGRLQGLHAFVIQAIPAFRLLHDVMPLPDIGPNTLPKLPDAPGTGLEGPGGGNGLGFDPFDPDAVAQMAKDAAALVNAQIATQRATAALAKEAAQAVKEAAEAADRSFTHMRDMAAGTVEYAARWVQMGAINSAGPNGWGIPKGGFQSNIYWTNQLPGNIGQGYAPSAMPAITGMNDPFGYGVYHQPPSRLAQYRMQFSSMQSDWRQQNFGTAEGLMYNAQGWGSELQDISEHGDPLVNATNVRGRGKRAAMGALKGAELGGKFGGPYGAAGGAVVGALVGAFRNPAFEDVWNRIAKNFGVTVSDELAKRIADRAKDEFHNNRGAAEVRSLGDILGETGGITAENVGQMTDRLHDAFSMFGTGVFDKKALKGTLDEAFGYYADYYTKIGGIAEKSFTDIVRLSRESGVESAAVTKYVTEQVNSAASGLEAYLENATVKSQSAASGLGASMILLFDEIRKGPDGLRGAIDQIGPMILTLQDQMTAAGFDGSEAFKGMLSYVKAFSVDGVAEATTAVDGLTATLEGLNNSTLLNAEAFSGVSRAMTDEINVAREALIAQGEDGDNALRLNAQGLQTIWELQKQYGWAVDESTQAMLDQAEAQGLIGAAFMDTNKQMLDAMNHMAETLDRIANHFGAVGDAATDAGAKIDDALERPRTVPVTYEFPDGTPAWNDQPGNPNQNPNGYAMGGVVRPRYAANGLFVPRGTDTVPAMLTPGEGVLSRRGMRTLAKLNDGTVGGGGNTFNVTIHADSAEGGKAAARAFTDELKRRGIQQRSVA